MKPPEGTSATRSLKVDLHVHSSHSGNHTSWFLRAAGANECYTSPKKVYELAMSRGMDLVTITDHDEIAGALELAALYPNTFLSEEISAKFPDDDCTVHVIAVNIDEQQHREIQRLRNDIYELAAYIESERIGHFLCHPLAPVNRRLSDAHLKQCFLMFRNVEVRNGTRDTALEGQARRILASLTPERLAEWAHQYPQAPFINRRATYGLVGGSDDHAGLSVARAYTEFAGDCSGDGLIAALRERRTSPNGETATADVISHNIYGVIAGVLANSARPSASGAGAQRVASSSSPEPATPSPASPPARSPLSPAMSRTLMRYSQLVSAAGAAQGFDFGSMLREGHTDAAQDGLHRLLEQVLVTSSREALAPLKAALESAQLADAAEAVSDVLKAALLAAPAVLAMRSYAHDRRTARELAAPLAGVEHRDRPLHIAVLTDSVDETNGVALGLKRFAAHARAAGLDVTLFGLGDGSEVVTDGDGIVRIPAVLRHRLRDYPQLNFGIPHFPSLMHHLVTEDVDLVQCSTPGPMGIAGLLAARLAGIPVVGQYHTDVPVYASRLTGDTVLTDLCAAWVGWFYRSVDAALAPSRSTRSQLIELGVPTDKIHLVPRGVELDLFKPDRRDDRAFQSLGVADEPKVLYVGRISREKGLDALLESFTAVWQALPSARLVLVGDGPYRETLAARAPAGRVIFAGEQTGVALAQLYASADLFVYPSETETFGNAVVEAQAAGLPVVVATRGATKELVVAGVTGVVVDASDASALGAAITGLLANPQRRQRMGEAAARHARRFDPRQAAVRTFDLYRSILAASTSAPPKTAVVEEEDPVPTFIGSEHSAGASARVALEDRSTAN